MAEETVGEAMRKRSFRLIGLALAVALTALFLLMLPDLYSWLRNYLEFLLPHWGGILLEWSPVVLAAVLLTWRPRRLVLFPIPDHWWTRLDSGASHFEGRLSWLVGGLTVLLLAQWIPSYLTWPLWNDAEQFAVAAQAWDAGLRPYRDQPDFDFPAPIYLFWILGKLFGWGRPAAYYLTDAVFLLALGASLLLWSRRRFGTVLAGWVGFLIFGSYYVSLNYALAAQRDWHASLAAVLGLLALQTWPAGAGRPASALLLAIGCACRPQAILFLPAYLSALDEGGRKPGEPWIQSLRAFVLWGAMFGLGLLLAFFPLAYAGVLDDFVRRLGAVQYGGSYNRVTLRSICGWFCNGLLAWKTTWILLALLSLAAFSREWRRPAVTWTLALLGALLYKPLSPVAHAYTDIPLVLVWSVGIVFLAGWLINARCLFPSTRLLLLIAMIVAHTPPNFPRLFRPREGIHCLVALARGETPRMAPRGSAFVIPNRGRAPRARYPWEDYQAVIAYLRRTTTDETLVANFLRSYPYPTINGSVGRRSPFPAAGGILWLEWVNPDDEGQFARSLEQAPDSVVVWIPGNRSVVPRLQLPRIQEVIRRLYEPDARFGLIEVWRRKKSVATDGAPGSR